MSVKLSAYADDIVVLINDQEVVNRLIKIVEDFGKISSSKINWSKSSAMLVGNWQAEKPNLPGEMLWTKDGFKYLGAF